ncbi:alpha/beta hydrolase [Amylibacter sp. IMCC11727]|uniref:alpha/beta fold hydrolase n=1 Tax=Amylibacter sp. IMCC11727 TaxID=3039851 RepID=UPI00244E288E|nr:alpha/beta hydrolase [Amylibacter sp. IMCC11727]WGI22731.1 alpha/beta hydrolase [Amylibacter sp. IMCC11727]
MDFLEANGRRIAYRKTEGTGPGVVFLGGFKSDMEGTKAVFLEDWAKREGRAFLRFDYSGHGSSSEDFTDGCIGEWAQDAIAVLDELTEGPQVLVGSSMGGWMSLLCARARPDRVAGLVGIAAAPDFTEDSMWMGFSDSQKDEMARTGRVELPSEYDDGPYVITQKLIEDGREQLVLRSPLDLPFPVRLLHGTADVDVVMDVPLRIVEHVTCDDLRLTFVKGADHRFSDDACLQMIADAVKEVSV